MGWWITLFEVLRGMVANLLQVPHVSFVDEIEDAPVLRQAVLYRGATHGYPDITGCIQNP